MNPKFKEILLSCMLAGVVAGGALGFGAQAKAGPLDQGPHILVGQGHSQTFTPIAAFADKRECLAARDDLLRQLKQHDSGKPPIHANRAYGAFLACIPGRST